MKKVTYDKVECDFNSWNLTQGSIYLLEDRLFFFFRASKTNPFCQKILWTILATTDKAFATMFFRNLFEQFP